MPSRCMPFRPISFRAPVKERRGNRANGFPARRNGAGIMTIARRCNVLAALLMAAYAGDAAAQRPPDNIPHYVNDPSWPKPFPNHWVIGQIGGLFVDSSDHIWVLQRPLPYGLDEASLRHDLAPAERMPSVLEFDTAGNILRSW